MLTSKQIGSQAEMVACHFLQKHGLTLKEQNFVALNPAGKRCGEIDLVMMDCACYVFVEVKLRAQEDYGDTLEMINPAKQGRVKLAAKYYLTQNGLWDRVNSRFDVIGITPAYNDHSQQKIVWIKNAFEVQYWAQKIKQQNNERRYGYIFPHQTNF